MEIVRYSPAERTIPGYLGQDALIRFYKDPEEYKAWVGGIGRVITFAQDMRRRDQACNYSFFEEVTRPFPRHLFGPNNEGMNWSTGRIPHEQQKRELRENNCYFFTGTHPASYTLGFIEAWMTGIPIVAVGPQHGNAFYFPGHDLYEIPKLITNGVDGFFSDDMNELRQYISALLNKRELVAKISAAARKKAIELFGRDAVAEAWKKYLG